MSSSRDSTFDVLKGIAIISMVIGHCELPGSWGHFISSFHMPLFFFVSGYFLKPRAVLEEVKLSCKRLLVPYCFTAVFICLGALIEDIQHYTYADGSHTKNTIIAYLLGLRSDFVFDDYGHVGVLWFILALFWSRIIVVSLLRYVKSQNVQLTIVFVLAFVGIFLSREIPVPYCIFQSFGASGFVYVGYLMRKYEFFEQRNLSRCFPFLLMVWFYCLTESYVSMVSVGFALGYIFDMVGAAGAVALLHVVVKNMNNGSFFWRTLNFWGRYSLVIYCVHSVEFALSNWKAFALLNHIPLAHFTLFQISARMLIAFAFTLLLLKIKPVRQQVFQIE